MIRTLTRMSLCKTQLFSTNEEQSQEQLEDRLLSCICSEVRLGRLHIVRLERPHVTRR